MPAALDNLSQRALLAAGADVKAKDKLGMTAIIVAAQLDNRNWKIGHPAGQGGVKIVEYVLEGETVENWSELVTWQYFPEWQKKASLFDIYEDLRKLREQRSPTVTWKLISKSDNEIMYWWSIENHPRFEDQIDIARMLLGKDGIHVLHYTIKNLGSLTQTVTNG